MIISEKHLRKVIREIIIESDEGVRVPTSYEDVRDEVEAEHNRPKLPDQVTTDKDDTGSYDIYLPHVDDTDEHTRLLNKRNQLTVFSSRNQHSQSGSGLDHLISLDNKSRR